MLQVELVMPRDEVGLELELFYGLLCFCKHWF